MIRALIVDDETAAREKIAFLLQRSCSDTVQVVGEAADGEEALAAIERLDPELLFLDVEMPRTTGFELLRRLPRRDFEVIFTTAYDHYAIKAIKFSAIDYLLKPIDIDQIKEAVERVLQKRNLAGGAQRVDQLMENTRPGAALSGISIPGRDGFVMARLEEIIWCEAVNYYTVFHLTGGRELVATRTLKEFGEMLYGHGFVRIHHSHLINLAHLQRYIKGAGGQVVMSDGRTLDVSRRKKDELMAHITGH